MIEQGFAQQRMWMTNIPTVDVGSDQSLLPQEVEAAARNIVEAMADKTPR